MLTNILAWISSTYTRTYLFFHFFLLLHHFNTVFHIGFTRYSCFCYNFFLIFVYLDQMKLNTFSIKVSIYTNYKMLLLFILHPSSVHLPIFSMSFKCVMKRLFIAAPCFAVIFRKIPIERRLVLYVFHYYAIRCHLHVISLLTLLLCRKRHIRSRFL